MSDFRRVITALAVLALLTGFGVTASAQGVPSVACTASVVNLPTLRAEGITELVGDIQVLCTNNAAATTNGVAAFTVFVGPSATVTSRTGEAGLIMNPGDPTQKVYTGTPSGNTVSFSAVTVNPAGSTTTAYLITNVRINATGIGAGPFGSTQVLAFVTISGFNTPVSLTNAGQNLVVGVAQPGLSFSVRKGDNSDTSSGLSLKQCVAVNKGDVSLILRYAEGFQASFKTAAGESGNTVNGALKATATTGTRLRAVFKGIPTGTSVYVAISNSGATAGGTGTGLNLAQLTLGEIGPFFALSSTDTIGGVAAFKLPVDSTGTAEAVWEVQGTDPSAIQNLDFPIFFAASGPTAGQQGTVNGAFAPVSAVLTASDTAPVPRFVDNSTPKNVIIFNICKTSLLFPFVSAANGFDTGIAIANTTADGGTTTPQSGTCTLNFFGTGAPSAVTTPTALNGGDVFANVLSSLAPGYQGYIIANCNFQDAHGFAFVQSTVGYTPSTAAMGYLALVLERGNSFEAVTF